MSSLWPDPDERGGKCSLPGIYRFTVEGAGIYVGRFTHGSRPLAEYARNVRKLLMGEPYRPSNHNGFRAIHLALHLAVREGRAIKLEIVENVAPERLNERERYWIAQVPPDQRLNGRRKP